MPEARRGPESRPETDATGLLKAFNADRAHAAMVLFAHRHPQASPEFHITIMDLWRAKDPFVVIEAFREAGKSTLSEEFILLEAAYHNFEYLLLFGETYTKACQRLAAIKHEAVFNDRLKVLFGDLTGPVWNNDTVVFSNGVRIEAHGWDEEIRGYKWLDARPDRAYLDDVENKTLVRDTAAVDAQWSKLNTELIPALDKIKRKVRVTGTPLADDCLLSRCEASAEWVVAKFPLCRAPDGASGVEAIMHPQAISSWPARWPIEEVRREYNRFSDDGLGRGFIQEYMLIAAQTQGKPFTEEDLVFTEVEPPGWLRKISIMDPARTSNRKSDRCGHIVASRLGSRIYVHESGGDHWKPDEVIADVFASSDRHGGCEVAIERNSLDEWLMQPLREAMLRRGQPIDVTPILAPHDRSKEQFILGLQPWFKAGDIIFVGPKSKHAKLAAEIANFPSGKRDILNALAYAQRVFGGAPVYPDFSQANIIYSPRLEQGEQLAVTMHATANEVAGVLVALLGRRVTVLAEWTTTRAPAEALRDISALLRGMFPSRKVTWWVAADLYEQQGRVQLVEAMRSYHLECYPAGYVAPSRGALTELIRSTVEGRHMLQVSSQCIRTLNALSGGYRYLVGTDGKPRGEPEKNVSSTLCIALEVLTAEVHKGHTDRALPEGFGATYNAYGAGYLSALKR
jgi:hypothetical protein